MNQAKATSVYERRPGVVGHFDQTGALAGGVDRPAGLTRFAGDAYTNSERLAESIRLKLLKILTLTLLRELEGVGINANRENDEFNLQNEVEHFEAELIRSALIMTGGRQRRAAKLLGMKVTTLHTKIRRYGLNAVSTSPHSETHQGDEPTAVEAVRTSLELVDAIFDPAKHIADSTSVPFA